MYHTGNYLQQKRINPTIPHGSHLGSPHMANPFAGGELHCGDDNSVLRMNCTMPLVDTTADTNENSILRTSSGGFFFRRKRTVEEQRLLSRQRAAEMIAEYEMSDTKEESLNRKGNFGPPPLPSLGACLSAQQAAFATLSEKRTIPLGQRERNEWDKRSKDDKATASKPSRLPLKPKGNTFTFEKPTTIKKPMKKMTRSQQRIEIARATRMRLDAERAAKADGELASEVGWDIVPVSPGVYSVAPTMAETPSPRPPAERLPSLRAMQQIHRLC